MTRPGNEDRRLPTGGQSLPNPDEVNEFHRYDDVDNFPEAHHHTLGIDPNQASFGDHNHDGRNSKILFGRIVVTGSRGGNEALAALLTALANHGFITDSTTI